MAKELRDIVLNYPGTHSAEDVLRIMAAFRVTYPDMYEDWEDIELHVDARGEDPLRVIAACVIKFLMDECTVPDNMGAISMFGELRRIVGRRQIIG